MNLEEDLRRALRRKPAPADFSGRVLARVNAREARRRTGARGYARLTGWLTAAAAAAVIVVGVPRYYEHRQRLQAEHARRELIRALTITHEKLALVQQRLQESQPR